ncbi:SRPBCC family protein [Micromonospora echinofusca]|uniref:Polyketide cyclase n=1 Tax=Micromonospora echinofusca TaxID=47858 RepID=A0ABS3VSZ8_MICEH|nr:SRPBCC family protein [Micromonospora echinofusca]MBO4207514.1 polyketide cyclase [Micromonospora echinofusca]
MAVTYRQTVEVAAPAEAVARVLLDVADWPTWNASVAWVDRPGTGPLASAETVRLKQHRLPANTWTVTDLDATGFTWTATSAGVHSTGDHRVRPVGADRAEVTLTLTLDGPLARLTTFLGARLIRRYLGMEADGLRRRVEHSDPDPAAPAVSDSYDGRR